MSWACKAFGHLIVDDLPPLSGAARSPEDSFKVGFGRPPEVIGLVVKKS